MTEDPVFLQERPMWAAETPVLLLKEPEKEESVGRRSGDENCGFELEVRLRYLGSGGLIFGDFHCESISTYSTAKHRELESPLSGKLGFFVGGHEGR